MISEWYFANKFRLQFPLHEKQQIYEMYLIFFSFFSL